MVEERIKKHMIHSKRQRLFFLFSILKINPPQAIHTQIIYTHPFVSLFRTTRISSWGSERFHSFFLVIFLAKGVVTVRSKDINTKILESLKRIEEKLNVGQESFLLVRNGLKAYKERVQKDLQMSLKDSAMSRWYETVRHDSELRFPHRKIIDVLLAQYDYNNGQFMDVHFSKLVKEARIGKNKAKSYLDLLEQKGYIEKWEDGYRKFFRIRG